MSLETNMDSKSQDRSMFAFVVGLFMICAGTLMYEVILTRLLSAISWYYLAFVSISMAMFGMTVGALTVQLGSDFFGESDVPRRLVQASWAMAISMPLALLTMLALPVGLSFALETVYSFTLLSAVIAVPFFFSGVIVCLALTKSRFSIGRVYSADLLGAGTGCFASILLLKVIDGPSGILAISSLLFFGASAFARFAGDARSRRRFSILGLAMLFIAGLNASTLHGIQPIWAKGKSDNRLHILADVWNPISDLRAEEPSLTQPMMWGPSSQMPYTEVEQITLKIDYAAASPITRFTGDLSAVDFLRYDVTSIGAKLRAGGTAAIIGVGGGRDVLNCALNHFHRIVGIEINEAIVNLIGQRLVWFSGFDKVPGFELHNAEGRSYLTRSGEKFDLIQASLVDTWAATSAGAMTLSENALYTVDGWKVFFEHLRPGGIVTFSRWTYPISPSETNRLFAVAWATLLAEGVSDPSRHIALVSSGKVATLLLSNQPLSDRDLESLNDIALGMKFSLLFVPGQQPSAPELRKITAAGNLRALSHLGDSGLYDYSPVFDTSPYFFNAVRLRNVIPLLLSHVHDGNLLALLFLLCFMVAATVLVILTILWPVSRWASRRAHRVRVPAGAVTYFVMIGLGFILIEMAMMQQLSIFLGHPIYSLAVVLAGLILATGLGSFISDKIGLRSILVSRMPAIAVTMIIMVYSAVILPVMHHSVAAELPERVVLSLVLVAPCGLFLGFCFPVGLRWMKTLHQEENLPWMWALNGAAATLGSFVAIVISMNTSIAACLLTGASCYLIAGLALPRTAEARRSGEAGELPRR